MNEKLSGPGVSPAATATGPGAIPIRNDDAGRRAATVVLEATHALESNEKGVA